MGKVIQMSDYRSLGELKRIEKDFTPPRVYNIRLEFMPSLVDGEPNTLMYDISNKNLSNTIKGKHLVIGHLLSVITDLCQDSEYSLDAVLDVLEDDGYGEDY